MLASPIIHVGFMNLRIDLSQLAEVGDPFIWKEYSGSYSYWVAGFTYRYRDTPGGNPNVFKRALHRGPWRSPDLTLVNPAETLLTVREEQFEITGGKEPVILYEDDGITMVAKKHIEQEHASLIKAWEEWKEVEPEIYAIIRQRLG